MNFKSINTITTFSELLVIEKNELAQHQHIDFLEYKKHRLLFLEAQPQTPHIQALVEYCKSNTPNIGLFPGSFNPFHKGHYNILQKAEKIFDKVIIAFGKNPDKLASTWQRPETINNRQQVEYSGLLTDLIDSIPYEVTVIRGLRNSTDFNYEQNQYRYMQELKSDIKIINIFCDKEFEHISSSGIRTLEKYNKHKDYLLK